MAYRLQNGVVSAESRVYHCGTEGRKAPLSQIMVGRHQARDLNRSSCFPDFSLL